MGHPGRAGAVLSLALLAGCGSAQRTVADFENFDLQAFADRFEPGSIIGSPRLVECKLSEGITKTCVAVTLPADPTTFDIGPWCPTHISDGADRGGIWLDSGRV